MPRPAKTLNQLHEELEQLIPDGFQATPHGLVRDLESERQSKWQPPTDYTDPDFRYTSDER